MALQKPTLTVSRGLLRMLAAALLLAVAGHSPGQAPTDTQIPDEPDRTKQKDTFVRGIIREQRPLTAAEVQDFDDHFNKWQFALISAESQRARLSDNRAALRKFFIVAPSGPGHDRLNDLALTRMTAILRSAKFGALVKYHAMVVIADLNEVEAIQVGNRAAAKPLPAALPLLVSAVQSAGVSSAVRVAAMAGVERHAQSHATNPLAEPSRASVVKAMIAILEQQSPPPGFTPQAQLSLKTAAMSVLGNVKAAPSAGALAALEAAVLDLSLPAADRCAAVKALGDVAYPPGAKSDFSALAAEAGRIGVELCWQELKLESQPDLARRNMRHYVMQLGKGVNGWSRAAGSTAHKATVDSIKGGLGKVYGALPDGAPSDATFFPAARQAVAQLERIIPPRAGPEAAEPVAGPDAAPIEPNVGTPAPRTTGVPSRPRSDMPD